MERICPKVLVKAGQAALFFGLLALAFSGQAQSQAAEMIHHEVSPIPAIHGPRITGGTPGRPFLFRVPATGQGPLRFSAENLPPGLSLDPRTGIITGTLEQEGRFTVKLAVNGPQGQGARDLIIVAGSNQLALTPPLGWNSWNVWGLAVDDAKVRAAAEAMVASGLASHGFQYINIDDGWEKCYLPAKGLRAMLLKPDEEKLKDCRAADGAVLTNDKFPDMKALADYVHSKGLKLGIYSSPGPLTCGGYTGSFGHAAEDAAAYAEWGIDYLKYDWCSYTSVDKPQNLSVYWAKPYREMRGYLDQAPRDIVFSICQYGMGNVWEWGAEAGGNLWRTTGDINDTWKRMSEIGFGQNGLQKFSGPGRWNDPDMLVVGQVGWGPELHQTRLTPDEQITHITLWAMLAAPLLIGCDMANLDPFTLDLLTNDEVLEVDQDLLGRQGARSARQGRLEVWSRPLGDGTLAVALFNRSEKPAEVTARWSDLGLHGPQPVRDLWRHQDLGTSEGSFSAPVPPHGAVMLKIGSQSVGGSQ